ncbi:MAG TPA: hypothetical protein VLK84_16685, partial [Longimicrobium sp.]|nr:hypothetical protein [Longimicrobium sp.]
MRINHFCCPLCTALALILVVAGCSKADNVVAPPAAPSLDGGWGYGSGGRSDADTIGGSGTAQQQGTGGAGG